MRQEHKNGTGPNGLEEALEYAACFSRRQLVVGIALAAIVLWGFWGFLGLFEKEEAPSVVHIEEPQAGDVAVEAEPLHKAAKTAGAAHPVVAPAGGKALEKAAPAVPEGAILHIPGVPGVAFVEATVSVLEYELNERFWGWRKNDIIRFTDNVECMQLGVLEVVRRTSVALAERLSRHGAADVIDENLQNAMNWFMIKPDRYWLPSPEGRYDDGLRELEAYADKLKKREARFYTRSDSLIPLLATFAELLGSCDENLVKKKEEDGTPVGWSKVDDYFYYARGVAKAMGKILEAVGRDFSGVMEARRCADLLGHAIHSCHVAADLDPWIITDASLDGILANHRANMAAPISHVRYYLDTLVKTLST